MPPSSWLGLDHAGRTACPGVSPLPPSRLGLQIGVDSGQSAGGGHLPGARPLLSAPPALAESSSGPRAGQLWFLMRKQRGGVMCVTPCPVQKWELTFHARNSSHSCPLASRSGLGRAGATPRPRARGGAGWELCLRGGGSTGWTRVSSPLPSALPAPSPASVPSPASSACASGAGSEVQGRSRPLLTPPPSPCPGQRCEQGLSCTSSVC